MTVETTNNRKDYTSNGTVTVFPYDFVLLDDTDLDVYLDGVLTASGYTVTRNANDVGGNVTFSVSPGTLAVPVDVLLYRQVPITQPTGLEVESKLPSPTLEGMSDRLTMIAQQLKETSDRSITLDISSTSTGLVFPSPEADMLIGWNAAGTALENTAGTPGPKGDPGSMTGPAGAVIGNIPTFANLAGSVLEDSGIAISGLGSWVNASTKSGTWINDTAGSNVQYPVDATAVTTCNLVAATGSGKVSRFTITTGSGGLTINRNGADTIDYLGTSTTNITMAGTTSGVLDLQDVAAGLWRVV